MLVCVTHTFSAMFNDSLSATERCAMWLYVHSFAVEQLQECSLAAGAINGARHLLVFTHITRRSACPHTTEMPTGVVLMTGRANVESCQANL